MSTAAEVNIEIFDSGYFQDAFRFGDEDDVSWSFTGKTFICEIKASRDDAVALLVLTSGASEIVVDNATTRVLHFFVSDDNLRAALPPAMYVYDLIMVDGSTSARTPLMYGTLTIKRGVTLSD